MRSPHVLLPLSLLLGLSLLRPVAVGADSTCDSVRWLLELDRITEIEEGVANPYADTWLSEGVLEPAGVNGPETIALRVRQGPEGPVAYGTPDSLAIESNDGFGCDDAYCEAGPRVADGGKVFSLYEGVLPEGDLAETDSGEEADDGSLLVEVNTATVAIVAPSALGKYTVVYRVVATEQL